MKDNQRKWRSVVAVMMVVAGLMATATTPVAQSGGGNPNPRVLSMKSNAYGSSYAEWSARWWQWLLSIPAATNPNFDTTGANCAEGQTGHVWFLAATFGGGDVVRSCTVPPGRALFFPILNAVFGAGVGDCAPSNPVIPCDVNSLRADAATSVNNPTILEVTIDGTSLRRLIDYRVQSPVFSVTLPADAVFGLPAGTFAPHVSDGYWLMLAPLSAGAHTIHFHTVGATGFEVDVRYNLIVGH